MRGTLPGGLKSSLAPISEDDISLLMTPYADWAPSPFHNLPDSALQQAMMRIGSNEDPDRLVVVEKKIQAMKSRLWEGILPMGREQWRKKGLHKDENFGVACQYLSLVVDAFHYLVQNPVASNLRTTYNLIYEEFETFDRAVDALRSTQGGEFEKSGVAGLWKEFMDAHFKVMTTRAHAWVIGRVVELRGPILEEIAGYEPAEFEKYDEKQWELTNKLHDLTELAARADFTILMPMDGYKGFARLPGATEGQSPDLNKRRQYYGAELKVRSRKRTFDALIKNNLARDPNAGSKRESRGLGDPLDIVESAKEQIEAQDELRTDIREPFTVAKSSPQWVGDLRTQVLERERDPVKEWGFVIYRLTYMQTDEVWSTFQQQFEADAARWGEDVIGADVIKGMATLKWIDGREHAIAEGDVSAATKHFAELRAREAEGEGGTKSGIQSDIFLFVDAASVASYAIQPMPDDMTPEGDFGGFVTAVEANFDPSDPGDHADESPGFTGQLRILGGLIWSDLYALAQAQVAFPEDLWPLAMDHPWKVFVGATTPAQRQAWKKVIQTHGELLQQVTTIDG
ncbi:hypothetical protein FKW77_003087 [Venturia effusa]|uniref:Uncharacterized protein n=1 Tax=Venturia effusa TaxID=50376 RepID=A0A517LAN1_9PEZI|nr:hypothetical protein FKW77_003087 [Venturia effusa]